MADPFIGEIRMFAGNFAPAGWAFCDGQLLSVSSNNALFSLLGTIYGGDGRTTFGLPELRGRIPIHRGSGPGLTPRNLGVKLGTQTENVSTQQVPAHTHTAQGTTVTATTNNAAGKLPGNASGNVYFAANDADLSNQAIVANAGSGQSHNNIQPVLVIHFIIALFGIYPSRN